MLAEKLRKGSNAYWLLGIYRESGITLWSLDDYKRARALWEQALSFSGYDFEYRLAIVSTFTKSVEHTDLLFFSDWTWPLPMLLNSAYLKPHLPNRKKGWQLMAEKECRSSIDWLEAQAHLSCPILPPLDREWPQPCDFSVYQYCIFCLFVCWSGSHVFVSPFFFFVSIPSSLLYVHRSSSLWFNKTWC
jgi:hypothetical protein